ncbi:MAG: hypothetical protein S4CHLAM81_06370 [Chlamydiales bacterium]|nr:hypothetical protein [Chlamydiales bacterium]MCH9635421.1 hypothetical protein [Chlamydiales bacterium]
MKKGLCSLLLILLTCSWSTDLGQALEKSQIEKRPLLLLFTASEWSGWSMKLKDEVLSSDLFKEKIEQELICVEIDSPKEAVKSCELERFSVSEFPTMILLAADQREIARFGYMPMTAEQLADDLLFTLAQDRDLSYLMDLIARGERTRTILERAYHLAEALCNEEVVAAVLDFGINCKEPGLFLLEKYRRQPSKQLRDQLVKLDDAELMYHVALIDFQENPGIEPLMNFLERYGKRAESLCWQLEMMIAQYYLENGELELAIQYSEKAQQSAPQNRKGEISHSIDYMRAVDDVTAPL